jgi:predicted alpha-1,6-mannanase (GH76 family)
MRSLALAACAIACAHCGDSPSSDAPDASLLAIDASLAHDAAIDAATDAPNDSAGDATLLDAGTIADARADANVDSGPPSTVWHDRSDLALRTMLLRYFSGADQALRETTDGTTLTGYWTNVQGLDAVIDGVERTKGEHYAGLIETFYVGQSEHGGFARDFYDDENWMALALIRAFDLTQDPKYLATAKTLYADIMNAWDTTCCGTAPGNTRGGVWWDRAHTQKATAANAGAVITGVRLGERTSDASYASFAKQVFAFWAANMVDPSTHQVTDHISANGDKVAWKFTYNEGLMIGAGLELARVTGDASYGATADAIASFVLANEVATQNGATSLFDGTNANCAGDCIQFKGIAFRYLTMLARARPNQASLRSLLDSSANAVWDRARDPATSLFANDWLGPTMASPPIEAASSAAMALGVHAELTEPIYVSDGARAAGIYEAEEATLHHVGLEAMHAGFHGWGYVAGWGSDGQSVTFRVHAASAKTYSVTFAFSAFSAATRTVKVGGQTVIASQSVPTTTSWDAYAMTTASLPLAAGDNDVSIVFDASAGSAGFLNLDRIVVGP